MKNPFIRCLCAFIFCIILWAEPGTSAETNLIKINYVNLSLLLDKRGLSGDLHSISFSIQNLADRPLQWVKIQLVIRSYAGELVQTATFEEDMTKQPLGPQEARQITHYVSVNGFLVDGKRGSVNVSLRDYKLVLSPTERNATAKKEIADGELLVGQGNYDAAVKHLSQFVSRNPTSEYLGEAHYWIGEAFYRLGQYDKAVKAFGEVVKYPDSGKVPASYRLTALAFAHDGVLFDPINILWILIQKFPQSEEASKARDQLKAWSGLDRYIGPPRYISLIGFREAVPEVDLLSSVGMKSELRLSKPNIKASLFNALRDKLPDMVINESSPARLLISIRLAQDQKIGDGSFFGTVVLLVLDPDTTRKNGWGMTDFIAGPLELAHSTVQDSIRNLVNRFAADWYRDNP